MSSIELRSGRRSLAPRAAPGTQGAFPRLVLGDGTVQVLRLDRWMDSPTSEEHDLLQRARPPVLDVGCGPGRLVVALAERGVMALGVDVAPTAVGLARRRGALVMERSVFDRIPGAGRWGSALLVDGNVGIGGDPARLLGRMRTLLVAGGSLLLEVGAPGSPTGSIPARLHAGAFAGPWFPWARVGVDGVRDVALAVGFRVLQVWPAGARWFAELGSP